MPNIKSAKKRVLVTEKKNLENKSMRSELHTQIKKFNDLIDTLKLDEAEKMLPSLMAVIDEAESKGIIHKNNASNKKSRLSARLSGVKSGKIVINIKKDNKTLAAERAQAARAKAEALRAENLKKIQERAAAKEAEKAEKATTAPKKTTAKKSAEKTVEKKTTAKKTTAKKSSEKTED